MYAVTVTFKVKPGAMADFLPLMHDNAAASRSEAACRHFDVCTDPERPDDVFLYEIYEDRAGFDAHLEMPHFLSFRDAVSSMVEEMDLRCFADVAQ